MRPATALTLARPARRADRGRFGLLAGAIALAGALLLAAAHIARMPVALGSARSADLANYVTEEGLRVGVVLATLLLVVPVCALIVQALRVGSVARDRRMASLRLAGATPRDVRLIAALEAGGAALAGGLLAGPAYLAVWLVAGVLAPAGARMLDAPDALDVLSWALLIALAGVCGALAGAAIHGRTVVEPLGVRRRARPVAPGRAGRRVLVAGIALVATSVVLAPLIIGLGGGGEGLIFVAAIVGLLLAAFAGGPRLVLRAAAVLVRRGGAEGLLAGRRLQADPRSAGRVAAVLVICGLALGTESLLLAQQVVVDDLASRGDAAFYLAGYGMVALAVLAAAVVALLTLLVGAADGLLDARRPVATLSALGVDEAALVRVLGRQLTATAVPAIVVGVLAGGPAMTVLGGLSNGGDELSRILLPLLAGTVMALAAALALWGVARLAARLLRPLVRAAIDPENLRVA